MKFKNNNRITVLFFDEDDDKEKGLSFLRKNKFSVPLLYTSGNEPEELFSGSLPTTIVLNKEGKIVYKHEGMAGYDTDQFINDLKKLF